ncbi:hypothetical protein L1049_026266 [Liquidambar formosana]|uniref:CST complex subunit CTC1 n=1 Tax=Liquidambar formosana TaxID=63359 RepID=A0AAP0NG30_LIQFO
MEAVKVLTVYDLLQRSRPLTATSSLHSPPSTRPPDLPIPPPSSVPNHTPQPPDQPPAAGGSSYQSPNPRILAPLNHRAILIGTLALPTHGDPSASTSTLPCSNNNYFLFSDGSSSICCDVLDFDVRIVGKRIHVLSWNFIPFKRSSGFLEIIKWGFPGSTGLISWCSNVESFPLVSNSSPACYDASKTRFWVHGALESISPVSVVPCTTGTSTSRSNVGSDTSDLRTIRGFLVQIMVCECKLCKLKESVMNSHDSIRGRSSHSFAKRVVVYFSGSASSWHPVITKLIGNIVSLSGLKKKLVFIGKEESQLMYVTTEKTLLHVPRLPDRWLPYRKTVIEGKGECGVYTGTVKGVYMQGMVVELDEEVWLLLTDRLLTPLHSLRVGALISVGNVHFVNQKISGRKMLILGACVKTSINVESFSPLETGCHMVSQSQSLLGKFIESLSFSARLWVLLVVSCFKKKFDGILSVKEILGSKHKEGLAQVFACSRLPSSVFRSRHGVFMELCKHDSCGCGSEPNLGHLKLVVPISYFLCHCEATWTKALLHVEKDCKIMNNRYNLVSCEGKYYDQSIRRIFSSEDIGIVLLGSLKISPSSGRLQLIDATGSIDVVIPDLPSIWNVNSIYEVIFDDDVNLFSVILS